MGQEKSSPPTASRSVEEQQIKENHGCGKYISYLNYQKPNPNRERKLIPVSIEILDPQFPPKMFAAEWIDDPKNKSWEWAKQFLMKPPAPPTPPPRPFGWERL